MTKTIKEMAENSGYPTLAEKAAYWDGANAVLEKIEELVQYGDRDPKGTIDALKERIWRLKQQ